MSQDVLVSSAIEVAEAWGRVQQAMLESIIDPSTRSLVDKALLVHAALYEVYATNREAKRRQDASK